MTGVGAGSVTVGVSDSVDPRLRPDVCVYTSSPDPCPVGSGGGTSTTAGDAALVITGISQRIGTPGPTTIDVTFSESILEPTP